MEPKDILEYYGADHQVLKAVEELTELNEVLIKYSTKHIIDRDDILDELADVYIMLEQIGIIFEIDENELDARMLEKLERQEYRIKMELSLDEFAK